MPKRKPSQSISLQDWLDNQDLRFVSTRRTYLYSVVRAHHLRDGQGILFSNVARTRFRIVAVLAGVPVLLLPPTDSGALMLSLFLQASRFVRALASSAMLASRLDAHVEHTEERVLRQRRRRGFEALRKAGAR